MKTKTLVVLALPLVLAVGACSGNSQDIDLGLDLYLEYLENTDPEQLAQVCEGAKDLSADVADGVAEAEVAVAKVKAALAELDAKVADKCE